MQNAFSVSNTPEFIGLGHSDEVGDDGYLLRKGLVTPGVAIRMSKHLLRSFIGLGDEGRNVGLGM